MSSVHGLLMQMIILMKLTPESLISKQERVLGALYLTRYPLYP